MEIIIAKIEESPGRPDRVGLLFSVVDGGLETAECPFVGHQRIAVENSQIIKIVRHLPEIFQPDPFSDTAFERSFRNSKTPLLRKNKCLRLQCAGQLEMLAQPPRQGYGDRRIAKRGG